MKPNSPIPRGYSPSAIQITLRPGQVVTITATDESGSIPPGAGNLSGALPFAGRSGDTPLKSPDTPLKSPDTPLKSPDAKPR